IKREIEISDVGVLIYGNGDKDQPLNFNTNKFIEKNILTHCIDMRKDGEHWKNIAKRKELLNKEIAVSCNDPVSVLFTSGTTGKSKGVMLSNYNLINNSRAICSNMKWDITDKFCISVPLFHTFGITCCVLACMLTGAEMKVLSRSKTKDICEAIDLYKCTVLNGVPSMYLALLRSENRHEYDISKLKSGIIAGSPIFRDDYFEICRMFDNIKLQPSYGQTETSPCITICNLEDELDLKAATSGSKIEHVQLRIMSINGNRVCEPYEEGEIQVKGYNVMLGYINNEKETKKAFTEDGWLKTGDLGFCNNSGYVNITGRCKNIIIRGGENISPVEIENAIKEVVKQCDVKVFGVPSIVVQEEIVACIEGEFTSQTKEKIMDYLHKNISDYKVPKYMLFIKEMPRNTTGKIDENTLKQETIKRLNI
ncbi:MAG: AMP-binding protein, partial [Anaerovoracaceae bacterium]